MNDQALGRLAPSGLAIHSDQTSVLVPPGDQIQQLEAPVQGDAAKPDTGTMPAVPEAGWDLFAPRTGAHSATAQSQKQALQTVLQTILDDHVDLDEDPAVVIKDCFQLVWESRERYRKRHRACQKELDQLKHTCADQAMQNHKLFLEQSIHLERIKTRQQEAQDMANVMAHMYQNQQEYSA
jgi:hypothetical protein